MTKEEENIIEKFLKDKNIMEELDRIKKDIEEIKKSCKPVEIPTPFPVYPNYYPCWPCINPCRDCINCPNKYPYYPWQPNITWKYEYTCNGNTIKCSSF